MQTPIRQWQNFTFSSGNHAVVIFADEPTQQDIEELAREFLESQKGLSLVGEYYLGVLLSEEGERLATVSCSFGEKYVLVAAVEGKIGDISPKKI